MIHLKQNQDHQHQQKGTHFHNGLTPQNKETQNNNSINNSKNGKQTFNNAKQIINSEMARSQSHEIIITQNLSEQLHQKLKNQHIKYNLNHPICEHQHQMYVNKDYAQLQKMYRQLYKEYQAQSRKLSQVYEQWQLQKQTKQLLMHQNQQLLLYISQSRTHSVISSQSENLQKHKQQMERMLILRQHEINKQLMRIVQDCVLKLQQGVEFKMKIKQYSQVEKMAENLYQNKQFIERSVNEDQHMIRSIKEFLEFVMKELNQNQPQIQSLRHHSHRYNNTIQQNNYNLGHNKDYQQNQRMTTDLVKDKQEQRTNIHTNKVKITDLRQEGQNQLRSQLQKQGGSQSQNYVGNQFAKQKQDLKMKISQQPLFRQMHAERQMSNQQVINNTKKQPKQQHQMHTTTYDNNEQYLLVYQQKNHHQLYQFDPKKFEQVGNYVRYGGENFYKDEKCYQQHGNKYIEGYLQNITERSRESYSESEVHSQFSKHLKSQYQWGQSSSAVNYTNDLELSKRLVESQNYKPQVDKNEVTASIMNGEQLRVSLPQYQLRVSSPEHILPKPQGQDKQRHKEQDKYVKNVVKKEQQYLINESEQVMENDTLRKQDDQAIGKKGSVLQTALLQKQNNNQIVQLQKGKSKVQILYETLISIQSKFNQLQVSSNEQALRSKQEKELLLKQIGQLEEIIIRQKEEILDMDSEIKQKNKKITKLNYQIKKVVEEKQEAQILLLKKQEKCLEQKQRLKQQKDKQVEELKQCKALLQMLKQLQEQSKQQLQQYKQQLSSNHNEIQQNQQHCSHSQADQQLSRFYEEKQHKDQYNEQQRIQLLIAKADCWKTLAHQHQTQLKINRLQCNKLNQQIQMLKLENTKLKQVNSILKKELQTSQQHQIQHNQQSNLIKQQSQSVINKINEQHQHQIRTLKEQIQQFNQNINTLTMQNNQLIQRNQQLAHQNKQRQEKIITLEQISLNDKQIILELEEKVEKDWQLHKRSEQKLMKDKQKLIKDNEKLQQRVLNFQKQVILSAKREQKLKQQVQKMMQQLNQTKSSRGKGSKEKHMNQKKIEQTEQQKHSEDQSFSKQKSKFNIILQKDNTIRDLNQNINRLKDRLEQMDRRFTIQKLQKAEQQQQILKLQRTIRELSEEISQWQFRYKEREDKFREEEEKHQDEIIKMEKSYMERESVIKDLRQQMRGKQEQTKREYDEKVKQYEQKILQLRRYSDNERSSLTEQIQKMHLLRSQLVLQLQSKQLQLQQSEQRIKRIENQKQQILKEKDKQKEEHQLYNRNKEEEVESLQRIINEKISLLQTKMIQEENQFNTRVGQLNEEISNLVIENQRLVRDVQGLTEQLQKVTGQNKRLSEQNVMMRDTQKLLRQEATQLKQMIDSIRQQNSIYQQQNLSIKQQNDQLMQNLRQLSEENTILQQITTEYKDKIMLLQSQISKISAKIMSYEYEQAVQSREKQQGTVEGDREQLQKDKYQRKFLQLQQLLSQKDNEIVQLFEKLQCIKVEIQVNEEKTLLQYQAQLNRMQEGHIREINQRQQQFQQQSEFQRQQTQSYKQQMCSMKETFIEYQQQKEHQLLRINRLYEQTKNYYQQVVNEQQQTIQALRQSITTERQSKQRQWEQRVIRQWEEKVSTMKELNKKAKHKLIEQQDKIKHLQYNLSQFTNLLNEKDKIVQELIIQVNKKDQQIYLLKREININKDNNNELVNNNIDKQSQLNQRINTLTQQLVFYEHRVEELTDIMSKVNEENNLLKEENQKLLMTIKTQAQINKQKFTFILFAIRQEKLKLHSLVNTYKHSPSTSNNKINNKHNQYENIGQILQRQQKVQQNNFLSRKSLNIYDSKTYNNEFIPRSSLALQNKNNKSQHNHIQFELMESPRQFIQKKSPEQLIQIPIQKDKILIQKQSNVKKSPFKNPFIQSEVYDKQVEFEPILMSSQQKVNPPINLKKQSQQFILYQKRNADNHRPQSHLLKNRGYDYKPNDEDIFYYDIIPLTNTMKNTNKQYLNQNQRQQNHYQRQKHITLQFSSRQSNNFRPKSQNGYQIDPQNFPKFQNRSQKYSYQDKNEDDLKKSFQMKLLQASIQRKRTQQQQLKRSIKQMQRCNY